MLLYVFLQQDPTNEDDSFEITTIPKEINEEDSVSVISPDQTEKTIVEKIMVDVKGAVHAPGVYVLTAENRMIDAIEMAGGYTDEALSSAVNHAQKLTDEMLIYIPTIGEEVNQVIMNGPVVTSSTTSSSSADGKVNLNNADETTLTTLPGIGASKAKAIIAYREENGSFKSIEDLKNVSGIGDKTFEKLSEFIVVK